MLSCLSLRVFFLLWDRIFVVGIHDFVYSFQRLFISYQLFYFWVCRPPFFGHTTIVILGGRIRLGITRAVMISDAISSFVQVIAQLRLLLLDHLSLLSFTASLFLHVCKGNSVRFAVHDVFVKVR